MFFFVFFLSLIVIGSGCVIAARNPVHSVLFLVMVFSSSTGLLCLLNVEFLALVFVVVYMGAIAVLFLFVVMMLNIRIYERYSMLIRYLPILLLVGGVFMLNLLMLFLNQVEYSNNILYISDVSYITKLSFRTNMGLIGQLLYTYYYIFFILCGILLLIAMVGAIMLTMYHRKDIKRQKIYDQVLRDWRTNLVLF